VLDIGATNVEIVRRTRDAYNRRDLDGFLELVTEDFVLLTAVAGTIEAGGIRGREGVRRYFDVLDETWAEFRIVLDEFRDLGDRVLVLGRTEGRGRGSGVPVDSPYAAIFDFRDGKWWRARGYLDHGEALRVAGLQGSGAGVRCEAEVGERTTRVLRHGCERVCEDRRDC
jgi:ketosteroid isomerase-like protein